MREKEERHIGRNDERIRERWERKRVNEKTAFKEYENYGGT